MKKLIFLITLGLIFLAMTEYTFAERDWEYWSQNSISVDLNKKLSFVVLPEWRFRDDMSKFYLFKIETAPVFKINDYLEIAPYYVYQEKKTGNLWDGSSLFYSDTVFKIPLKKFFDLKISNRVRYQYDFDKDKTTWRNSLKISKNIKIFKFDIAPYISEEPFYDARLDRIVEHRTSSGISFNFSKYISFGIGYMLNSKKSTTKWTYANVLVTSLSLKF